MGRGADGLPEFSAGPQVTEAQMVALFGEGRHPDAELLEAELIAAGRGVPAVLADMEVGLVKWQAGPSALPRLLAAGSRGTVMEPRWGGAGR